MDTLNSFSYNKLFLLWIGGVIVFAVIFTLLSYAPGHNGPSGFELFTLSERFWNAIYYSIITATNTGYGDIIPLGYSKFFAALESVTGLFLFALFMTKLVSHRQDIALREVHKLSFEDVFHNMREDLYVARKDFDRIMQTAEDLHGLGEEEWEQLMVAYQQIASLLQEIPDFYDGVNNLYTLDPRREELMHEAVHRTLHRINQLLDVLSKENIDWISHDGSVSQLRDLIQVSKNLINVWRQKSPYHKTEPFEQILHVTDSIHARIHKAFPVQEADNGDVSITVIA